MWQSLSHGANYKSAYCMAVCPAGEDVIGPYLQDPQRHLTEVVKPLQERAEPVYVVPGSDAEAIARRKFKNKTVKPVSNGLRPRSIEGLLNFMPYVFQPNQSRGLDATFHFTFTGTEEREITVRIQNRTLDSDRPFLPVALAGVAGIQTSSRPGSTRRSSGARSTTAWTSAGCSTARWPSRWELDLESLQKAIGRGSHAMKYELVIRRRAFPTRQRSPRDVTQHLAR